MLLPKHRKVPTMSGIFFKTAFDENFTSEVVSIIHEASGALKHDSFSTHDAAYIVLESSRGAKYISPRRYNIKPHGGYLFSDIMQLRLAYFIHSVLCKRVNGTLLKAILMRDVSKLAFELEGKDSSSDIDAGQYNALLTQVNILLEIEAMVHTGKLRLAEGITQADLDNLRDLLRSLQVTPGSTTVYDESCIICSLIQNIVIYILDIFKADPEYSEASVKEATIEYINLFEDVSDARNLLDHFIVTGLKYRLSLAKIQAVKEYAARVNLNKEQHGFQITSGGAVVSDAAMAELVTHAVESLRQHLVAFTAYNYCAEQFLEDCKTYLSACVVEPSRISEFNEISGTILDPRFDVMGNAAEINVNNIIDTDETYEFEDLDALRAFKTSFEEQYSVAIEPFKYAVKNLTVKVEDVKKAFLAFPRSVELTSQIDHATISRVLVGSPYRALIEHFENDSDYGAQFIQSSVIEKENHLTMEEVDGAEKAEFIFTSVYFADLLYRVWLVSLFTFSCKNESSDAANLTSLIISSKLNAVRIKFSPLSTLLVHYNDVSISLKVDNCDFLVGDNTQKTTIVDPLVSTNLLPQFNEFGPDHFLSILPSTDSAVTSLLDVSTAVHFSIEYLLDVIAAGDVSTVPTQLVDKASLINGLEKATEEAATVDSYLSLFYNAAQYDPSLVKPYVFTIDGSEPSIKYKNEFLLSRTLDWCIFPVRDLEYKDVVRRFFKTSVPSTTTTLKECLNILDTNISETKLNGLFSLVSDAAPSIASIDDLLSLNECVTIGKHAKGSGIILTGLPFANAKSFFVGIVYKAKVLDIKPVHDSSSFVFNKLSFSAYRVPVSGNTVRRNWRVLVGDKLATSSCHSIGVSNLPVNVYTNLTLTSKTDLLLAMCLCDATDGVVFDQWVYSLGICSSTPVRSQLLKGPVPLLVFSECKSFSEMKQMLLDSYVTDTIRQAIGAKASVFYCNDNQAIVNHILSFDKLPNFKAPIACTFNVSKLTKRLSGGCIKGINDILMTRVLEEFNENIISND